MRKVELKMNQLYKYQVIKKLVDTNGNKKAASLKLQCTTRNINLLIKKYKTKGKKGFIHGNTQRKPVTTIPDNIKKEIILLYENKYSSANWVHFRELLIHNENITISYNALYRILKSEGDFISPKCTRRTKKNKDGIIRERRQAHKKLTVYEEDLVLNSNILTPEESHARVPRAKYFGELLEMDACDHLWFGDKKSHLHGAIDSSTGRIVALYFDHQETLKGYYNVLFKVLTTYGIPYKFLTDNRTVFIYNKQKKNHSIENDSLTQFGFACKQLGIELATTSVPQSKGRIERLWGTLQSRLTIEMKLANIQTIEEANEFLDSYTEKFNKQFALPINNTKSCFESKPSLETINNTLSVISNRIFDRGSAISYKKTYYQAYNRNDMLMNFYQKTKCLVIKTFDNKLICSVKNTSNDKYDTYLLKPVLSNHLISKDLDEIPVKTKSKKNYIPPMTHPWRIEGFIKYVNNQKHHKNDSVDSNLF